MPPKATEFKTSFESQTDDQVIDASVDDTLRSYMDSGDAIFENEDVDGNGLRRETVVDQVRTNILKRLDEENRASVSAADQERGVHRRYSGSLVSMFGSLTQNRREYLEGEQAYNALEEADRQDNERNANRVLRFFKFRKFRKKSILKKREELNRALAAKIQGIVQRARDWDKERIRYKESDMRKHYKAYDALAKSWYELTHERAVSSLPEDATEEQKQQAMESRAIPEEYSKKIVEYTGVYDIDNVARKLGDAVGNINTAITADDFTFIPYKRLQDSHNQENVENLTKTHTRILLLSEADESTGIKTRYKFDSGFLGDRAKRQFTAADSDNLGVEEQPQAQAQAQDPLARYAENYHLESDRRDVNNRFLFSEKNAEILHANLRRNGKKVYGFLMNGEFLTNDTEGEEDEGAPDGRRVAGKQDMEFFGRRNWNKQEKAEKLRVAIRTAPFFKHVNARTIQYYSGYNADSDFGNGLRKEMNKFWQDAQADNRSKEDTLLALRQNPASYNELSKEMKGPALVAYVLDAATRERGENEPAFSFTEPNSDPVLSVAMRGDGAALRLACMAMLTENNPQFWGLARKIIVDTRRVNTRTLSKLKYLPKTGMMMRMGLLDELANHQGVFSEIDLTKDDIMNVVHVPQGSVYMEELKNRRGAGNWFKKNLLNGELISTAIKSATTGFSVYENASDADKLMSNPNFAVDSATKSERLERKVWLNYASASASAANFTSILGAAGIAATWQLGGDAKEARSGYFQYATVMKMFNKLVAIIKAVIKFIKYVRKKIKQKKVRDMTEDERIAYEAEQRSKLKDLDATTFKEVLKFLSNVVGFINSSRELASYHVAEKEESLISHWLTAVNKQWGELLAFNGPLQYILDTAQNCISIIEDITDIVVNSKRISRIDAADRRLQTALSAIRTHEEARRQNQQHGEEQPQAEQPQAEQPLTEDEALGKAASENSQAQYFMSLTKMQSRKQRSSAGWDIGARTLSIAKDTFSMTVDPTSGVVSKILRAVLSPAPMLANFLGWVVGKVKYDKQNFKNNIGQMLGDPKYVKTSYFDKVLRRETGIVSSDYLVDLARIFTSIDTHVLINKPEKTGGEMELAKTVVGTLYGNVNEDSIKTIKLSAMMKYAGVNGESDWRALLRNSITDK
ncbi:MAG: hypothetical protein IJ857_09525 [Lachnospiraceae bacterium]|nr:hypothetical protein [Lachnospiraceae bacterium]